MDVVIQKEALLSTLFSDNVVIIEWDWTRLRNPFVLFDFWQMFCIWALIYEIRSYSDSKIFWWWYVFQVVSVKDVNYLYWFFLFVIGRTTHLPELNSTIHFSSRVASLLRFSFKLLLSIERVRYAIVSSVNRLNVPRCIPVELRTICVRCQTSVIVGFKS